MNHRDHQAAIAAKRDQTAPMDDDLLQLLECINSGQAEPEQLVQHFEAGEFLTPQPTKETP